MSAGVSHWEALPRRSSWFQRASQQEGMRRKRGREDRRKGNSTLVVGG